MSEKPEFFKVKAGSYYNIEQVGYKTSENTFVYRYIKNNSERMKALIALCLISGLFHKGWNLIRLFTDVLLNKVEEIEVVVVHHSVSLVTPRQCVAVGVVYNGHIQIYVLPKLRRRKIGASIIRFFKQMGSEITHAEPGERGSKSFWRSNGVTIRI